MTRQYYSAGQKMIDQTIRSMRRDRLKRERENLTPAEIDDRIVKAILAGAITKARFSRCLDVAREIDPAIATVQAFA